MSGAAGVDTGDLSRLGGIGPKRAEALAAAGFRSLADLVLCVPRQLEEMPAGVPLAEAVTLRGQRVRVAGTVRSLRFFRKGKLSNLRVTIEDPSGRMDALFFNQPWQRDVLYKDREVVLVGHVGEASSGPVLTVPRIGHAEKPLPAPGTLRAVYAPVEGFSEERFGALVHEAFALLEADGALPAERADPEALGAAELLPLDAACRALHWPRSRAEWDRARRRLVFERLFGLAAVLVMRRRARVAGRATPVPNAGLPAFADLLPFTLTGAQERVATEILADLATSVPMGRLLQGDVGSGKTAIAALAAIATVQSGGQVALMAPTEVLAWQHFEGWAPRLERAGIEAAFLTGALRAPERRAVQEALASGRPLVCFGTHALFSASTTFANLRLVIVDEEHRFGVGQRERLAAKGAHCHRLSMTATPIPRSVARVVYGDLDLSVIDELPPGRGAVDTVWVRGAKIRRIPGFLRERLAAGERAFWVVPRIEDQEATTEGLRPQRGGRGVESVRAFCEGSGLGAFGIEVVHGRLAPDERRRRFRRFKEGAAQLLIGTTVIEVGVDVPAATVIVIEDADRLGLAQLHQLRGRVGRGAAPRSWCLLVGPKSAAERFELLESTRDGFEIAEADYQWRGMGDLAGARQSGENLEGLEDFDARTFDQVRRLLEQDDALLEAYLPVPS